MNVIKRLRNKIGLSQCELAQHLKVTQGAVSQWETGESIPSINKLSELSKVFGCSVDYLLLKIRTGDDECYDQKGTL